MKLDLVTCQEHPALTADDQRLLEPLRQAGFEPRAVRWDDSAHAWDASVPVVLRSPWDYHLRFTEFSAWLTRLEQAGVTLFNPASLVRWNSDKHYLVELAKRGVPVVDTELIEPSAPQKLLEVMAERKWNEGVVKPTVSAGAHQTVRFRREDASAAQRTLDAILARGLSAMVQPFLEEVQSHGEWSLFFFNRTLSHAVIKRAATGDFRVQAEFGGQAERVAPPEQFLRTAQAALETLEGPLLYARVDGIPVRGTLQIGEIELIEPALFLKHAPDASERFAIALRQLLK